MEVDLHQLELRHRDLRIHDGEQRRRLIGSLAEVGQQVPVVVIRDADRLVLIDGYLRVEALRRLHRDTAIATTWPVTEIEALVHHRHLSGAKRVALEDAWLLGRLREHGVTMEQLARQLCRSTSWVSRNDCISFVTARFIKLPLPHPPGRSRWPTFVASRKSFPTS